MENPKHRPLPIGSSIIFAVIVPLLTCTTAVNAQTSSFTFITVDIPLPDGQLGFTQLADINEEGQITGGFTDSLSGPLGFLLNFKKKVRSTETGCHGKDGKDVVSTAPQSINRQGEIVGFASVVTDRIKIPNSRSRDLVTKLSGFFRDRHGKCTILDFPGAILTEGSGLNDNGQVVGDYRDANGDFHGFLWEAGRFRSIDVPFAGANSTAPSGINNLGQIVGFYFDSNVTGSFPDGRVRGFLYDAGIFTSFDFPDAVDTLPIDLNDNGQIVGIFSGENDSIARSFLFDAGNFTTFDVPLSGVVATEIGGINNRGQIVGRYITSNPGDEVNPFLSHGFVANPNLNSPSMLAN